MTKINLGKVSTASLPVIAAILATCLVLAGCMERKSDVAERAHTKSVDREAVTIASASMDYRYLIDEIHRQYPEVKLAIVSYAGADAANWETYSLAADDAPDVFTTEAIPKADLQSEHLLQLSDQSLLSSFNPTLTANASAYGKTYLVPGIFSNDGLTYDVLRYYGISKRLACSGNEQKLEDALKVLKVLGTKRGQDALRKAEGEKLASSLSDESALDQDDPLLQISTSLSDGNCIVSATDRQKESATIAMLQQDFSLEETAQLVGQIYNQAAEADITLITMGGLHGSNEENELGVNGRLYGGKLTADDARTILPALHDQIETVQLTASEINALVENNFIKYDDSETGGSYPYVIAKREPGEIESGILYKVAFVPGTYSNYFAARHDIVEVDINLFDEAEKFFATSQTVRSDKLVG